MMAAPIPQRDDVDRWTVEQVAAWLQQVELADSSEVCLRRGIDGHRLLLLTEEELFLWGRDLSIKNRKQILKLVDQIKNQQQYLPTIRQPFKETNCEDEAGSDGVYCNSDTLVFDRLISKGLLLGDLHLPSGIPPPGNLTRGQYQQKQEEAVEGSSEDEDEDQDDDSDSFFSEDGEVDEDLEPEEQQLQEEQIEGDDDIYLPPRAVKPSANYSGNPPPPHRNIVRQWPPQPPFPSHHHQPVVPSGTRHTNGVPWNIQPPSRDSSRVGHTIASTTQVPGQPHGHPMPDRISGRGPAPLPGRIAWQPPGGQGITSHSKAQQPPLPAPAIPQRPPPQPPSNIPKRLPVKPPKSHNAGSNQSSPVESGGSGMKILPLLHHSVSPTNSLEGSPVPGPKSTKAKEPPPFRMPISPQPLSSYPTEKNDHVYETVDVPSGSYGGPEHPVPSISGRLSPVRPPAPPPRNQDFDGRETLSRPRPTPLGPSTSKRHPDVNQGSSSVIHSKRPPAPLPSHAKSQPLPPKPYDAGSGGPGPSQIRPQVAPGPPHSWTRGSGSLANSPHVPSAPGIPPHPSSSSPSDQKTFPQDDEIPIPQGLAPPVPGGLPPSPEKALERVELGDGEIIELTPLYRTIIERPYFHLISRAKAKDYLTKGEDGIFLIRPSTRSNKPLTLSLKHAGRNYNINIRQRPDSKFALGSERDQEKSFASIDELVSTHTCEPIKLQNGSCALLTHSPARSEHIYVRPPQIPRK